MSQVPALLKPDMRTYPPVFVERTKDAAYISAIINHPEISEDLSDGQTLQIPMEESIFYLKPKLTFFDDGAVDDVPIGVMAFVPVNTVTWNPHIAILPEHRGNGTGALNAGIEWMFENTPCKKIVAYPPTFNERMIHVFKKCGFSVEGRSVKSFLWRGQLHDRLLMGLEK